MKAVTVIGPRPQFIKAAAVSRVLSSCHVSGSNTSLQELVVHTGQRYDYNMSRVFFEELGIPDPGYHLEIGSGSHGHMTGQM